MTPQAVALLPFIGAAAWLGLGALFAVAIGLAVRAGDEALADCGPEDDTDTDDRTDVYL